jgi:hypothetical protein
VRIRRAVRSTRLQIGSHYSASKVGFGNVMLEGADNCCQDHAPSRDRICKRLKSPEIDSEESTPPASVAWRAGTTNRVFVLDRQAGKRFLGSLKRLQIWALKAKSQKVWVTMWRKNKFLSNPI